MPNKQTVFAKIGDGAVKAKTGKGWNEWYKILDRLDPKTNGHRFAVMQLCHKHKLSSWWSQAVTIHYEWERGLRTVKNQRQARPKDPLFKNVPKKRTIR